MVVGKQAQIGVGDGLPIAPCHTVVLEYAVGSAILDDYCKTFKR